MKTTDLLNKVSTNNSVDNELDTFYDFQSKGKPLKQIQVRHGHIVDGMRFLYGETWTPWGGSNCTGGETTIKFEEGEYIVNISGKDAMWVGERHIVELNVFTSTGKTYTFGMGIYYNSDPKSFDFKLDASYVIGFCIKSQRNSQRGGISYISDIGVYYINKEMEFISSLLNDYTLGKEKYKTIILETYRDNRVYALVGQLTAACSHPNTVIDDSMRWYASQMTKQPSEMDSYILKLAMLKLYDKLYQREYNNLRFISYRKKWNA